MQTWTPLAPEWKGKITCGSAPRGLDDFSLCLYVAQRWASQAALVVKNPPANAGDTRDASSIPGSRRSPEEGMATHSSILVWKIPWTEEPGGLQSKGWQRVRHD